jgi:hypothetical protein
MLPCAECSVFMRNFCSICKHSSDSMVRIGMTQRSLNDLMCRDKLCGIIKHVAKINTHRDRVHLRCSTEAWVSVGALLCCALAGDDNMQGAVGGALHIQ